MFNKKSGIAAIALGFMMATPALAQDHGMGGRPNDRHAAGQMSRADTRMMARCHRMSHRAMMRNRSCVRLTAMQKRMDRDRNGHRDMRMDGRGGHKM